MPLGVSMTNDLRSAQRGLCSGKSKCICGNNYNHHLLYVSCNTHNKSRGLGVEEAAQDKDARGTMILEGDFYKVSFHHPYSHAYGLGLQSPSSKVSLERTSRASSPKLRYSREER